VNALVDSPADNAPPPSLPPRTDDDELPPPPTHAPPPHPMGTLPSFLLLFPARGVT
jgi:hypothetical protein